MKIGEHDSVMLASNRLELSSMSQGDLRLEMSGQQSTIEGEKSFQSVTADN